MNAFAPIIARPSKGDELRRRTIYVSRAIAALQEYAHDYQVDPDLADLNVLDAISWIFPDIDALEDHMQMCRDELQINEDGFRVSKGSLWRDAEVLEHFDRVFTPRGEVL